MTASQLLGRGIGSKKFKLITSDYPNIIEIYEDKGKKHVKILFNTLHGFSDITTDKIVDGFDDFITYYKKSSNPSTILSVKKIKIKKVENKSNKKLDKYKNQNIVFTGFTDADIEEELENIGSKISSAVSKNTNLVVAKDASSGSNKLKKASELKIKIISQDEFYKSLK